MNASFKTGLQAGTIAGAELLDAVRGHVLAVGRLVGTFAR